MFISDSMDMNLSKLWELVMGREDWRAAVHGVAKIRTRLSDWTELKAELSLNSFLLIRNFQMVQTHQLCECRGKGQPWLCIWSVLWPRTHQGSTKTSREHHMEDQCCCYVFIPYWDVFCVEGETDYLIFFEETILYIFKMRAFWETDTLTKGEIK